MAITVTERWSGDSLTQDSPDARNYSLAGTRILDVTVDNPQSYDSWTVATVMSDPQLRAAFPDDFFMRCNNLEIKRVSPNRFEVHATYFTRGFLNGGPLSLPPVISWGSVVTEEEIPYDINGNALMTINMEPFDPPIRVPVYDRILTITRNTALYSDDWAGQFRNAVSSAPFYGFPAGTVRVIGLDAQSVLDEAFSYWRVTGQFQIRRAPPGLTDDMAWFYPVQAQGIYVRDASGKVVQGTDDTGNNTLVPVYHDITTGKQLTRTVPPADPTPVQYYFFQVFPSADLNLLGLI